MGFTEDHTEVCRSSPSEAIAFHAVASRLFRIILRFTIYSGGHHASTRGWGTFSVKVEPASGPGDVDPVALACAVFKWHIKIEMTAWVCDDSSQIACCGPL